MKHTDPLVPQQYYHLYNHAVGRANYLSPRRKGAKGNIRLKNLAAWRLGESILFWRWGDRFRDDLRRKRVEGDRYFTRLIHCIHYNPVHHQFCKAPAEWPYSSYRAVLSQQESKIEKETVLAWFGGAAAFRVCHRAAPTMELDL